MNTSDTASATEITPEDYFGPVIHSYTRAQAIADGFQVEVTETAKEAGIKFRVFLNRTVFDQFVTVPPGVHSQDEAGRLWDIVWMLACAIRAQRESSSLILFHLSVRNSNRGATPVTLKSVCGPVDIDDPAPAITIMLPGED